MQIQRVVSTFLIKYGGSVIGAGGSVGGKIGTDFGSSRKDGAADCLRIAVFHRQDTMPTFPSHWAACSGTIEPNETPREAAQRELQEETNWIISNDGKSSIFQPFQDGLFVDVPYKSQRRTPPSSSITDSVVASEDDTGKADRIIRVYPFVVPVPDDFQLELKGTEHDRFDWISVSEIESLKPAVPSLAAAFHHATRGVFWNDVSSIERSWASDRQNGATTMTRNALKLLRSNDVNDTQNEVHPSRISVLRPTMVTIINSMNLVQGKMKRQNSHSKSMKEAAEDVVQLLETESRQSIDHAVDRMVSYFHHLYPTNRKTLQIATFSRSSTIVAVIKELTKKIDNKTASTENETSIELQFPIICGKSTPGDEGELMAKDLNEIPIKADDDGTRPMAVCVNDQDLRQQIVDGTIDIVLIGADCVLTSANSNDSCGTTEDLSLPIQYTTIINKVGTRLLIEAANDLGASGGNDQRCIAKTRIFCCTDRFKLWGDVFPPPIEPDLFEVIPTSISTSLEVLVPPP